MKNGRREASFAMLRKLSSTQCALMVASQDGWLSTHQVDLSVQRASWGWVFLSFHPLVLFCESFRASSRSTVWKCFYLSNHRHGINWPTTWLFRGIVKGEAFTVDVREGRAGGIWKGPETQRLSMASRLHLSIREAESVWGGGHRERGRAKDEDRGEQAEERASKAETAGL